MNSIELQQRIDKLDILVSNQAQSRAEYAIPGKQLLGTWEVALQLCLLREELKDFNDTIVRAARVSKPAKKWNKRTKLASEMEKETRERDEAR